MKLFQPIRRFFSTTHTYQLNLRIEMRKASLQRRLKQSKQPEGIKGPDKRYETDWATNRGKYPIGKAA